MSSRRTSAASSMAPSAAAAAEATAAPKHRGGAAASDPVGALRKNKAYQQLRREMEQRNRMRRKDTSAQDRMEVFYVDRDRAAAVVIGNKDIKKDLRHKKNRDRLENASGGGGGGGGAIFEEVDFETQLLQGEHELRAGDPGRAVGYLTRACESAPDGVEEPFVLRSQCFCKLGQYSLADVDADQVLKINPGNVRGLTNKAEMQYNLGNFEHSLKYFHRANLLRPGHQGVLNGVNKAREAVDNALSRARGFSFGSMRDTIQMIEEHERAEEERRQAEYYRRLGVDDKQAIQEEEAGDADDDKQSVDSLLEEEERKRVEGVDPERERYSRLVMEVPPELEGVWDPIRGKKKSSSDEQQGQDKNRMGNKRGGCSTSLDSGEYGDDADSKRRRRRQGRIRAKRANKTLLGELHGDRVYLEGLLAKPEIVGGSGGASSGVTEGGGEVQVKVRRCLEEALEYLDARRDFWQQQKPVYARECERQKRRQGALFKSSNNKGNAVGASNN